jgi:alkanesulfonate monooxygenase
MQLGVHIADFTWTGGGARLGPGLARLARNAEDGGVSRLTVMLAKAVTTLDVLSSGRAGLGIGAAWYEEESRGLGLRYADACNIVAGPDAAHKLDLLREHCEREGRPYDSIEKTTSLAETVTAATDPEPLLAHLRDLHELGFTVAYATLAGTDPVAALGMLTDHVIPEISAW